MSLSEILPTVNALLNGTSAVLLFLGFLAVRRGEPRRHAGLMLAALGTSTLFLVGYLWRVYMSGTHRFPDVGAWKTFYLLLLFSHMILAMVLVPLVLRAVYLAWRRRFAQHRRVTRFAWPIWMYVSVTGVLVYWMLYHLAPALGGARA